MLTLLMLLAYCSDQFNLSSLTKGDDRSQSLRDQLVAIKNSIVEMDRQLGRVTEALLAADDGSVPIVFVRKARELEMGIAEAKSQENNIEVELRKNSSRMNPDQADAWAALVDGTLSLDYDTRMRTRQLVQDTFERIVIYHSSTSPTDNGNKKIDLLLIAKGGQPRLLRIDRKTGVWAAAEEMIQ
jgi:hypothetical protein